MAVPRGEPDEQGRRDVGDHDCVLSEARQRLSQRAECEVPLEAQDPCEASPRALAAPVPVVAEGRENWMVGPDTTEAATRHCTAAMRARANGPRVTNWTDGKDSETDAGDGGGGQPRLPLALTWSKSQINVNVT